MEPNTDNLKPEQSELFPENIEEKTRKAIDVVTNASIQELLRLGVKCLVIAIEYPGGGMGRHISGAHYTVAGMVETLRVETRCTIIGDINEADRKLKELIAKEQEDEA